MICKVFIWNNYFYEQAKLIMHFLCSHTKSLQMCKGDSKICIIKIEICTNLFLFHHPHISFSPRKEGQKSLNL